MPRAWCVDSHRASTEVTETTPRSSVTASGSQSTNTVVVASAAGLTQQIERQAPVKKGGARVADAPSFALNRQAGAVQSAVFLQFSPVARRYERSQCIGRQPWAARQCIQVLWLMQGSTAAVLALALWSAWCKVKAGQRSFVTAAAFAAPRTVLARGCMPASSAARGVVSQ